MNPEQPIQNPYDFILSTPSGAPRKTYLPKAKNKNGRILLIAALLAVLLIGTIIVAGLLHKPDPNTTSLLSLAETQHEINRIADAGLRQLGGQNLKNSAITTDLASLSQQNKTVAYLNSQRIKVTIAQLGVKKNSTVDTQLTAATQNNTYDMVFGQIMQHELLSYENELKTDYPKLTGTNARTLARQQYGDVLKLITQLNASLSSQ